MHTYIFICVYVYVSSFIVYFVYLTQFKLIIGSMEEPLQYLKNNMSNNVVELHTNSLFRMAFSHYEYNLILLCKIGI